jgi:hypothetical protein
MHFLCCVSRIPFSIYVKCIRDQERIPGYCEKREQLIRTVQLNLMAVIIILIKRGMHDWNPICSSPINCASTKQHMNATTENPKLKCRSLDEFFDNEGVGVD